MFEQIKTAYGKYLRQFFDQLVPTTKPMEEFCKRPYAKSVILAPARMIDQAEEMLAKYMRTDISGKPTTPYMLPVIILAIGKDYTPTGRDFTRQIADPEYVIIENDPKERVFQLRTVAADLRTQIAIFASDVPTAQSIAAQFLLFLDETRSRRFLSEYEFAGLKTNWPIQIEAPDNPAMSIQTEAKNLTILAVDVTLKVEVPLFSAPKEGEANDGKGVPGTNDPAGYPVVQGLHISGYAGLPKEQPAPDKTIETHVGLQP